MVAVEWRAGLPLGKEFAEKGNQKDGIGDFG